MSGRRWHLALAAVATAVFVTAARWEGLAPGAGADPELPARFRWWQHAAARGRACDADLAWPVGACGLGDLGGAWDLGMALVTGPVGGFWTAAGLTIAANVLAVGWLAGRLGARAWAATFAGVVGGAGAAVVAALGAAAVGGASVWVAALAVGAWMDARPAIAVAATALAGLVDPAWGAVALAAGGARLYRDRTVGTGLAVIASFALVAGGAAWVAGGVAPAEARTVAGSLRPSWPVQPGGPMPFLLGAVALLGLRARDVSSPRRVLQFAAVAAYVLSLGPRLLGPSGPAWGSHLPQAAFALLPGLAAYDAPARHAAFAVAAAVVLAVTALGPRMVALIAALTVGEAVVRPVALTVAGHRVAVPQWRETLDALPDGAAAFLPIAPELRERDLAWGWGFGPGRAVLDAPRAWIAERRPPGWEDGLRRSAFLAEWMRFERGQEDPTDLTRANWFRYASEAPSGLVADGLRWMVLVEGAHPDRLFRLAGASRELLDRLTGGPAAVGPGIRVWDLAEVPASGEVATPIWRMPSR